MPKLMISRFLVIRLAVQARIATNRLAATSAGLAHLRAAELNRTTG